MTVPEEDRPKKELTDDIVREKDTVDGGADTSGATGRTVREAFEEAGVGPDDFEEE